jgi:hypothetical protein
MAQLQVLKTPLLLSYKFQILGFTEHRNQQISLVSVWLIHTAGTLQHLQARGFRLKPKLLCFGVVALDS